MSTPTLAEAVAARSKAREHSHTDRTFLCCTDHCTAAERDAAALAACADLAAYVEGMGYCKTEADCFNPRCGVLRSASDRVSSVYEALAVIIDSDAIQRRASDAEDDLNALQSAQVTDRHGGYGPAGAL